MHSMLRTGFCVCMLLSAVLSTTAQKLDIKGTILDSYNVPVAGAIISLTNQEGIDTTDANGAYHIVTQGSNNLAKPHPLEIITTPHFKASTLHFGVRTSTKVKLSLYSSNGRLIKEVMNEKVSRGNWSINPFGGTNLAIGLYLTTVTIGDKTSSFKCINNGLKHRTGVHSSTSSTISTESSIGSFNRAATGRNDALDTLVVTVKGQQMTATPIMEPVITLPPSYIVQRDIYGDINLNGLYDVEKVYSVITQENSSRRQFAELFYNKASNSYSGFVYFMKSDTTVNYSVETYVYSLDGLSAFSTEVVPFSSNAGNIKMPTLNTSSSNWWFTIQIGDSLNDNSVDFTDTAKMKLVFNEPKYILGNIVEYYWDNGEGIIDPNVKPIWDDTLPTNEAYKHLYSQCGPYMVFGGFKTDFGQTGHRPQSLNVQSNNGAITLLDPVNWPTKATINDTIAVKVAGVDTDVIKSWEFTTYKLSGNVHDTILVNKLTTDTIVYNFTTGSTDTVNNYVITLVDKNDGYKSETFTVRVTNLSPSLSDIIVPTAVPPGQKYTVDLSKATDDGQITKREYRFPPTVPNFTTLAAPYTLELTSGEGDSTNSLEIRVSDDDGNVSEKTYHTISKNNPTSVYSIAGDSSSINDTVTQKYVGSDLDKISHWIVESLDGAIDTFYVDTPVAKDTLEYSIFAPDTVGTVSYNVTVVDIYGSESSRTWDFHTTNRSPGFWMVIAPTEVGPNTTYSIDLSDIYDDGGDLIIEYRFPPTVPNFISTTNTDFLTLTSGNLGTTNTVDIRATDNDGNVSEKAFTTLSVDSSNRKVTLNLRQHDGSMKSTEISKSNLFTIPGTEEYGETYVVDIVGNNAYIYPTSKSGSNKSEDNTIFRKPANGSAYPLENNLSQYPYSVALKASDNVVVWSQDNNWNKKDSIGYFEVISVK